MPITQPLVGHGRVDIESRYTLLEKIGSGTFATVYRARDNELGREVAVKQVHSEYMEKPESLEAFWGEAQLLASLQHPNIVTIYDIYRDRGWLILELMQTNLADRMQGKPLSVQAAKTTVAHCLRALAYLHERGVTHGDIKPSNMMIDARKRVKIGDFGLARRVSDEEGSLVKGTTKFMAPEIVSDEFGEIGPPSDLYSLGFSMYSLLCGENFEQLFPGLSAFGRNKQIAWMMWQAAPDRRIPEIGRVLQGVPEDLAHVVDKLVQKKQSERYPTARAALDDLGVDQKIVKEVRDGGPQVSADPEAADRKKRLILLSCVMAFSVILSGYMLFFSGGGKEDPTNTTPDVVTVQGFLESDGKKIIKVSAENEAGVREIPFEADPEIALQEFGEAEKYIVLRELKQGDRLEFDRRGPKLRIVASRPMETEGRIDSLEPGARRIKVAPVSGRYRDVIELRVTDNTRITRNGREAELTDLEEGNVVQVWHLPELNGQAGRVASRIEITETEETVGFFGSYDESKNVVRIRVDDSSLVLPVGKQATITLVERDAESNVSLRDLRPDDRVRVLHDDELKSLVATRDRFEGRGIVDSVDARARTFTMKSSDRRTTFFVPPGSDVVIGSPAGVADLRKDDKVFVTYRDGASGAPAVASSVTVDRKTQGNRWAILVATSGYAADLPELPYLVPDVRRLGTMLVERYTLPEARCLLLVDQKAVELRSGIERALRNVGPGTDEVVLYLGGHVLKASDGQTYFGGIDFDADNPAEGGVPLDWIVDQFESCPAETRLLLLDACHDGIGSDREPASEDVAEAIEGRRTVRVLASCSTGERGRVEDKHQLFTAALADGYAGAADDNADLSITPSELADYVRERLASRGQTPVLVGPSS